MPYIDEVYLSEEMTQELVNEFYQNYEDDYWYAQIRIYEYLLDHVEDVFGGSELEEEDLEDYRRMIKAEFTYMFYHSSEALLGLVRSLAQDGIPWIDLKETMNRDIDNFIENELQEDDFRENVKDVFYPFMPVEDDEVQEAVEQSVDFIWRYLNMIGVLYGKRSVYNEYKHGLRLMTSVRTIEMEKLVDDVDGEDFEELDVRRTEDGVAFTMLSGDVFVFLERSKMQEVEETGKKVWSLSRKIQALEFERDKRLCSFNADLIRQIFRVRRELDDSDEGDVFGTIIFEDIDIEEVVEPENLMQEFTINSYFPKSDDDVIMYELV